MVYQIIEGRTVKLVNVIEEDDEIHLALLAADRDKRDARGRPTSKSLRAADAEKNAVRDYSEHRFERHAGLSRFRAADNQESQLLLRMFPRYLVFVSQEIKGTMLSDVKRERQIRGGD